MKTDANRIALVKELENILAVMAQVPPENEEYKKLVDRYSDIEKLLEKKPERRSRLVGNIVKTALEIGIKAIGCIIVPVYLANLAYDEERALRLKNQTIWNMSQKKNF